MYRSIRAASEPDVDDTPPIAREILEAVKTVETLEWNLSDDFRLGKAKVDGSLLCEQFDGYFLDRMVCGYVLRNDDKLHPDMRYLHVTPQAAKYFSPDP